MAITVYTDLLHSPDRDLIERYDREVLEHRADLAGVVAARRGTAETGSVPAIALYDLDGPAVVETPDWPRTREGDHERIEGMLWRPISSSVTTYSPPETARVLHGAFFRMPREHHDDFHAWYDGGHAAFTLAIEGYLNARRFQSSEDPLAFLVLYDVERVEATREGEDRSPLSLRMREAALDREKRVFLIERCIRRSAG